MSPSTELELELVGSLIETSSSDVSDEWRRDSLLMWDSLELWEELLVLREGLRALLCFCALLSFYALLCFDGASALC